MELSDPLVPGEIEPVFDKVLTGPLALAVSGGADSVALMHLVAAWSSKRVDPNLPRPIVLTVDHALRPEARGEAAWVARQAALLGFKHVTLVWTGPKPTTGLQAAARVARYWLMSDFLKVEAREHSLARRRSIVTAHHADDQAETFLMRLARGSGLDGLSGMRPVETIPCDDEGSRSEAVCRILRPFLQIPKARLISTLQSLGCEWCEDPSNASPDYERVRVRDALRLLHEVGVTAPRIARSARRLGRARAAIVANLADVMRRVVQLNAGLFAGVDAAALAALPEELQVRIFATLFSAFGGSSLPARLSQIEEMLSQMDEAKRAGRRFAATLGGCRIVEQGSEVAIWRETGRVGLPTLDLQPGQCRTWDKRFLVSLAADEHAPVHVEALGTEGVRRLAIDPGPSIPRGALETLPCFRRDGRIVGLPNWPGFHAACRCSAEFVGTTMLSDISRRSLIQG